MSLHLFGLIVTPYGTAANNRGENEGNITTLQKILWQGEVHTAVSAEAIRFAIRKYWQSKGLTLNRKWNEDTAENQWADPEFGDWENHVDDDVMGFMSARAGKEETNTSENPQAGGKKRKPRGTITKRRSRLEITRAISLTPFGGDITFNAASPGATPSASSTGKDPVPYGAEVHATRYQYGFAFTPEALSDRDRAAAVIDALFALPPVAGNHARYLFDFSPESVIVRWTQDFAPRMLYGFSLDPGGGIVCPAVLERVKAGDIKPDELLIGGPVALQPDVKGLSGKGAFVNPGVLAVRDELKRRLAPA